MIAYAYQIEKSGDIFTYSSNQFPMLKGFGYSEDEAGNDFWNKMLDELNALIKTNRDFPAGVEAGIIKKNGSQGEKYFLIPTYMALKMYLHKAMLTKKVNRTELAKMLALTQEEVGPDQWKLDHIRQIKPKQPPKAKKVQRLLDIKHDSILNEISEAFRVMDYSIHFVIRPKGFDEWEQVITI